MTHIDLSRPITIPDWLEIARRPTEIGEGHLERQFEEIGDEVRAAIEAVLPTGKYTLGPRLAQFEQEFATYCESRFSIIQEPWPSSSKSLSDVPVRLRKT